MTSLLARLKKAHAKWKNQARIRDFEAGLPQALLSLATSLRLGEGFEEALARSGREAGGEVEHEFRHVLWEVKGAGASMPDALRSVSGRVTSLQADRAIAQLVGLYEQGNARGQGVEALEHLAQELVMQKRSDIKTFSGKAAVLSLFFITLSAVVPALGLAYLVVGSMFMPVGLSPQDVLLLGALVLPLANALLIFYIIKVSPLHTPKEKKPTKAGVVASVRSFLSSAPRKTALLSLLMVTAAGLAVWAGWVDRFYALPLFALGLLLPWAGAWAWALYRQESSMAKRASTVPGALFVAATFPPHTSTARILNYLARHTPSPLGADLAYTANQVARGAPPRRALQAFAKAAQVEEAGTLARLLARNEEVGGNLSTAFQRAGENMLNLHAARREMQAVLSMQRYTVLVACTLLIPLILGLLTGFVQGLEFEGLGELALGTPTVQRAALLDAALLVVPLYIGAFSLLCALYLASQQGHLKKALLYALVLLPWALGLYFFVSGLALV